MERENFGPDWTVHVAPNSFSALRRRRWIFLRLALLALSAAGLGVALAAGALGGWR